jgi:hypothetical protein
VYGVCSCDRKWFELPLRQFSLFNSVFSLSGGVTVDLLIFERKRANEFVVHSRATVPVLFRYVHTVQFLLKLRSFLIYIYEYIYYVFLRFAG